MERIKKWFKGLNTFAKIGILAAVIFFGSAVVAGIYDAVVNPVDEIANNDETTEEPKTEAEPKNEVKEVEENKEVEPEEEPEEKPEDEIVEHEERFTFAEFTIENIKTEIKDNELKLMFDWVNQSGKDDTTLTALAYFDVTQGNEILNEISDAFSPGSNSDVFRRVDHGIISPVTLIYEITNDEPVKITFGATAEFDDTTEVLIIE